MEFICFRSDAVNRVDPQDRLGLLHRLNIKIDRDSFAIAAHQDAFQDLISTGVDFLMRHVGRNKNEIARIGFGGKFQSLAPAHACLAAHHINDAFQMAMVVRPGLCIRFDRHGTCPQLLCARASEVNRRLAIHTWCRGHVGIELIARDDANAIVLPAFARVFTRHSSPFPSVSSVNRSTEATRSLSAVENTITPCVARPAIRIPSTGHRMSWPPSVTSMI